MSIALSHHQHFDGRPESARQVRRTVGDVLDAWGCDDVAYQGVLGASELASNAILHARERFELVMRAITGGARIEVIDPRPDLVPIPVPTVGSAAPVTVEGTTGRGLQIIAALADRWGFNSSQAFKAVWLEVTPDALPVVTKPIVELGYRPTPAADARRFRLLSLPVRAAVGSGVHVEDLVRGLQLSDADAVTQAEHEHFHALLDTSAPARLLGRHAALDAAARGLDRFDLDVSLSREAMDAFTVLNRLLGAISDRLGAGTAVVPPAVLDFRSWVLAEVTAQAAGHEPTRCDLPT